MKICKIFRTALWLAIVAGSLSLVNGEQALASLIPLPITSDAEISALLQISNPELQCVGSGETSGVHPGWSTNKSNTLTMMDISPSLKGLYWCPASAPSGKGAISYTVTASPLGSTCETTDTSCSISGVTNDTMFSIMATDQTGSYPINGFAIQNSGAIQVCTLGSIYCNPGPIILTSSYFASTALAGINDCTFAAIANWEMVTQGKKPLTATINTDFAKSGGKINGLSNDQAFNFWRKHGIGGLYLKSASSLPIDPLTLKNTVNNPNIKAVIAQLSFADGQSFAGNQMTGPEYHWVVVDGFTPTGPLAISWGQTLQMTWQQWNLEALAMWSVVIR